MRTLSIPYIPRLDERPTWETVEPILDQYAAKAPIATVNWPEYPERPEAMALIARSAQSLFLKFDVTEQSVRGTYTDDGSPVYQDSCVEFFVRHPDGKVSLRDVCGIQGLDPQGEYLTGHCCGLLPVSTRPYKSRTRRSKADRMDWPDVIYPSTVSKDPWAADMERTLI